MDGMEIEIFKAGTHTSMGGRALTYGEADVQAIADGYDPARYEAPVVIGHPKDDAPAWGWVKGLRVVNGTLTATLHKVSDAFADMVKEGRFRNRSVSLYGADAPGNPTPGRPALKHLAFLGAMPPAVKGLKPIAFGDGANCDVFEFAERGLEGAEVAALRAELTQMKAETRAREIARTVDFLVEDGRVLPYEREGVAAFMEAVAASEVDEICFADKGGNEIKKKPLKFLQDFFMNRPRMVEFREFGRPEEGWSEDADTPRKRADDVQAWVHSERAKGRNVTFADYPNG